MLHKLLPAKVNRIASRLLGHCMQPARQRLCTLPVPLIVTLLIAQALATACLGCS